jgi:hypothetical protein
MMLLPDTVVTAACDDARGCVRVRVVGVEREDRAIRATVLEGCRECEGATLVLAHQ